MAFDSMFTGISGLNAYQSWIDMISNNIANTETTGFKGQRMTFSDMFYQQTGAASGPTANSGGINPQETGLGVQVATVDTEFAQGGLETTGINTDLAINGDGFFILNNANGSAAPTYTRDGAFSLNSNGLLYDPASGLAVQGYTANAAGQITQTGTPADITIPLGQSEQATATGAGTKVGPSGDDVYDVALGGNLDQTQWSQQFLDTIGSSSTAGTPITTQTTMYDSLGNAHLATITYTPDAAGATAATVGAPTGAGTNLAATAPTVAADTSTADTITITATGASSATITDSLNSTPVNAVAGQVVTMGGATFTLGAAGTLAGTNQITVAPATNGLPSTVMSSSGQAEAPATRWSVSVSFADGTTLSTIQTPGSIAAPVPPATAPTVTAPTYTTASSGTIGYAYFNQNGQFINSSSIEGTDGQAIGAADGAYLHSVGGAGPSLQQGNQLNIVSWGPSAGNNASAPSAGPTPGAGVTAASGPIALDYYNNSSLAASSTTGSSTAGSQALNVISQNGYSAGTLDNITISANGDVVGAFTNGQNVTLAQVALATFQNEDGLERIGGNQFAETAASGLAQVGSAGSGTLGSIVSGSLEQSNVSLSTEFTNLILAQRAFEANTRGITTADQNLQTIIGLRASEN